MIRVFCTRQGALRTGRRMLRREAKRTAWRLDSTKILALTPEPPSIIPPGNTTDNERRYFSSALDATVTTEQVRSDGERK